MIYRNEGIITAISSIVQSGTQKTGAFQTLPMKNIFYNGQSIEIPYISGNSIRGRLRRIIMRDMTELLGYKFKNDFLWHAFFGGGQLQSVNSSQGMLDVKLKTELIEHFPAVGLLGFSLLNQMIESKLVVSDMDICCIENKDFIPAKYEKDCQNTFHEYLGTTFFTRKDDRNNGKQKDENSQAIQMKVEIQVIVPGTRFYHEFIVRHSPTPLEIACFNRMLKLWNNEANIGGKTSTGFGRLKLNYTNEFDDKDYLEYIEKNKEKLIKYLDNLSDKINSAVNPKPKKTSKKTTKKDDTQDAAQ